MLERLNLAIVDLETTGASAPYDRIIEVGIKRIEQGRPVQTYETLVNPQCRIPAWIQRLTGITDAQVSHAPTFDRIVGDIRSLLADCVFVAHNVRFDYGFLRQEFARLEQPLTLPCLCTVRLSRLLYPRFRQHGLSALIERFALPCARRHRALDDAEAVWAFLDQARRTLTPARLSRALQLLLQTPTVPPQLPLEAVESLPHRPGVYVFYDAHGTPLYIGQSCDIAQRVRAHFLSDYRSGKTMRYCQQVSRIEAHPTHGPLGAGLLEAHLIRTLSPLYNRRGHRREGFTVVCPGPLKDGYATVQVREWEERNAAMLKKTIK